jgi:hypothetical protein
MVHSDLMICNAAEWFEALCWPRFWRLLCVAIAQEYTLQNITKGPERLISSKCEQKTKKQNLLNHKAFSTD